jgi:PQQ enzyme repeat
MVTTALKKSSISCLAAMAIGIASAQPMNVTTHHYDNMRTGWNPNETVLTPSAVASASFGQLNVVPLDDQVDVQPLLVTGRTIAGGQHDVVYVATENNSIYALDATTGAVLLHINLGTPVPQSALPGQCNNNAANVGINGTPVIDAAAGTLYVITYTYANSTSAYQLHALDIDTLADKVPPVVITASAKLLNGQTYPFTPSVSRQRAALLLANGNVYAGFASFCDINANLTRGWVLGWNAATLAPLPANELTNKQGPYPNNFFLTSIWMSGSGLASSTAGDIYFVTGNSDPNGKQYNHISNISESVAQVSSDLSTVKSIFTPNTPDDGHVVLDEQDLDFGSGGVLLLPPQTGASSDLAVAAGKVGLMYLLNADSLGNNEGVTGRPLGTVKIGGCWCVASYYTGNDGLGRVVSSGGAAVFVWKVIGGGTPPLVKIAHSSAINSGQDSGFFTTVSSNGITAATAVIWAVGRPDSTGNVRLYAFKENGHQLFSNVAGTWPNTGGNANLVPVVANGKVYVASFKSLAIFGLGGASAPLVPASRTNQIRSSLPAGEHEISGIVQDIDSSTLTLVVRTGDLLKVDAAAAIANFQAAVPSVGHGILVRGTIDEDGVLHADTLLHAKDSSAMWQPDR